MSTRIFVTGSGGILGRHVLNALRSRAPEADIIRNDADLTNLSDITSSIESAGPLDLVIHLAALVPVDEVSTDPARGYAVNAAGTINLLAALSKSPARILYCSSGHVYASKASAIDEADATEPVSIYGKSKLLGEEASRQICSETGRSFCVARLFSIHDPAQKGSYLRPSLERRLASEDLDDPFELYGAESIRDFLTAEDAAHLLVRLSLSTAEGIVNVGSGCPMTVAEFAQWLAPRSLNIRHLGTSNSLVPNVARLNEILGD